MREAELRRCRARQRSNHNLNPTRRHTSLFTRRILARGPQAIWQRWQPVLLAGVELECVHRSCALRAHAAARRAHTLVRFRASSGVGVELVCAALLRRKNLLYSIHAAARCVFTPWAVYAFLIFEDASAELDCESFMLWHAVPAHLPLDVRRAVQATCVALARHSGPQLKFEIPT
jgi:hypothetical protein